MPILLVEDDEIDIELVKRALKRANIDNPFYNAFDGVEALEILSGNSPKMRISQPCILLLDINMPRMNGLELLQTIRADDKMKKNIVFVLTTSNRDEDKASCYDLNVAGYVLKENLSSLADMLGHYCKINESPDDRFNIKTGFNTTSR